MGRTVVREPTLQQLDVEVLLRSPFAMPRGSTDGTLRVRSGVATRFLQVEASPLLVRAWQPARDRVRLRAQAVDPGAVSWPSLGPPEPPRPAGRAQLETAIERLRFALGVDLDLGEFHRRFRRDPLVGPLIRRMPSFRPLRTPWPWEALAGAVVGQLIEADRAARIERRIAGRWGARLGDGREARRDVPAAATIAGRAPAELTSMDLAPGRAEALRRVAREVALGRCDLADPAAERRLLSLSQIGPWTVQRLGLFGRGDLDALPAGDLGYLKLVGRLANLGRRATIEEVEEFYLPYAPFRGLVGSLTLAGLHRLVAQGAPLRIAA